MATKAVRWTDEKLKSLRLPEGKSERNVLIEPNLYLRLSGIDGVIGARVWRYRAQVDGLRRWLTIGSYPEISLAKVGAERDRHDGVREAARLGDAEHPAVAEKFARKVKKAALTVGEVFEAMVVDKRLGSARLGGRPVRPRTVQVLTENYEKDIAGHIGHIKVAKLTREHMQTCIDSPRHRGSPGSAQQVFRTLRQLVNFALKRDLLAVDPMRLVDPPKAYRPMAVIAASDAEVKALFRAIDASEMHSSTRLMTEWLILTGMRRGEARLVAWKEIDLEKRLVVLPPERTKQGREHRIHLSVQALRVLDHAKLVYPSSALVFPSQRGILPVDLQAVGQALDRLAPKIGRRLTPHDLRRLARTILARIGVAQNVAEKCLGHAEKNMLVTAYDGHDYRAEMADAFDRLGAHIAALRAGGADVVSITSGGKAA